MNYSLLEAIKSNDVSTIKKNLTQGINPLSLLYDTYNYITFAILNESSDEVLKTLFDSVGDYVENSKSVTSAHLAFKKNNILAVKLLLDTVNKGIYELNRSAIIMENKGVYHESTFISCY